jgi:hypothetical protein
MPTRKCLTSTFTILALIQSYPAAAAAAVQQLLTRQRETSREYSDYENRALVLELQSLVDRYRMMDVEVRRCMLWRIVHLLW